MDSHEITCSDWLFNDPVCDRRAPLWREIRASCQLVKKVMAVFLQAGPAWEAGFFNENFASRWKRNSRRRNLRKNITFPRLKKVIMKNSVSKGASIPPFWRCERFQTRKGRQHHMKTKTEQVNKFSALYSYQTSLWMEARIIRSMPEPCPLPHGL